jgi:hypothetical protein
LPNVNPYNELYETKKGPFRRHHIDMMVYSWSFRGLVEDNKITPAGHIRIPAEVY